MKKNLSLIHICYMEEYIPGDTPQKILDIGGGPGRYSIFLAQKGHDVTLFDLSGKNIRQAIEKAQEADVWLDSCIPVSYTHLILR